MVSSEPTAEFDLIDHFGRPVTHKDFSDRHMLVYFGFTHCKVVCPRSLAKLSNALESIGNRADEVSALYITVDPVRDTPDVMHAYLHEKYPRFLGLTGSEQNIAAAKKAFRVFAEYKGDDEAPDGYVVPHTAIAYLMGPDGQHLDHFVDGLDEQEVATRMMAKIN